MVGDSPVTLGPVEFWLGSTGPLGSPINTLFYSQSAAESGGGIRIGTWYWQAEEMRGKSPLHMRLLPLGCPSIPPQKTHSLMKKTAFSALATAALIFAATSCGKHSWESTQRLHERMHKAHGDAQHGEAKHDSHAAPAAHAEKPAAH